MERIDSLLMLKYMISEGFKPNNYERILELVQSAPNSLSKDLVGFCNQYLLSEKVIYSELDDYGIEGANGYVKNNNILIPKTADNIERILDKPSFNIPSIDEFGATIFYQDFVYDGKFSNIIRNTAGIEEKFFGFIAPKDRDTEKKEKEQFFLGICLAIMNQNSRHEYDMTHDTIENKELYLIKRKK